MWCFLPCPPCLGAWLWALRGHGPCARRLALLSLLALELLGLLLVFTPLLLLGLLFVLLDGSLSCIQPFATPPIQQCTVLGYCLPGDA